MGVTFPENMGEIVRVFRSDASEIAPGRAIVVKNPSTGKDETLVFPLFDCIVSNLPFVRTEDAGELNTELMASTRDVLSEYDRSLSIERKSDLYAYFPFHLWKSLRVDGIFTFISSNSWLGSKWGRVFFNILSRFFIIDTVIASGNGRWFDNADVVTTATRLRRRRVPIIGDIPNDEPTTFVLTEKQLGEYSEDEIETLSLAIIRRESEDGICVSTTWTGEEIRKIESVGMSLNTLFFDLAPALRLFEAKKNEQNLLVSANSVFDFFRGERRGWNEFFYPENHEEIEDVYIKPILKKSRNISGLVAEPDCNGFFCSVSEENLESLGHTGVLSHIRSFENRRNGKGKLLKDVLTLPGCFWYEMRSAHQVDIVALMNYDRRLFFAATPNVSCIDQRFIGMSRLHETTSAPLCHALLNSLPGLFYIEALGFGRGLGVLDLSKERMENGLYMLNPLALDKEEQARILEAFAPLLARNVLALDDELRMDDRLAFDSVVAEVYGIPQGIFVQLRKTLLSMYHVRHSVNQ